MRCLHICNDLMGSKVHEKLYEHLHMLGVEQKLYYPLRNEKRGSLAKFNKNLINNTLVSKPLKNYHRFLFRKKINFLFNDLESRTDLSLFNLVHATTLFSDGAIALKIWKKYKIPYITAIRGTDVNVFLNYRRDLYPLAMEIIYNSKQLIFISDSLRTNFFRHPFAKKLVQSRMPSQKIIFNGLDSFWLENLGRERAIKEPTKFLYIGRFDNNKNVKKLIEAFKQLREKYGHLQLNLVGAGGKQEDHIKNCVVENKGVINYHGPIYDKKALRHIYEENHIFAMVSISETFGLVYVEALSQGLPILYTKGQGIDGAFDYIGEGINPLSVKSIREGMEKMILNYHDYGTQIGKIDFSEFSWKRISKTYFQLYQTINS